MIRLGLRLSLNGGRESLVRLVMIVVAVAIGVALLLTTLASLNAVSTQNSRYAWLETGYTGSNAPAVTAGSNPTDPLWWQLRADYFHGDTIGRVDLAATGPNSPVPPGISRLPAPGQYYASPALSRLLRTAPADQLGDRFPGRQVGTIGPSALPAPNSLIIIIGRSVAELAHQDGVTQVARISTTVPSSCNGDCAFGVGIDDNGMTLILSVVVAALLFPVLIFIGGATRLSAARREQRFAAMRLVGATPRQIAVISTVESSVATIVGVGLGFGLFYALRPALAAIPFTGDPFFTGDMALTLPNALWIALGIPAAAALAARLALRRVIISPLGVSRRVTPRPPRAWRVLALVAGIAELGYWAYASDIGQSHDSDAQAAAYLSGILLIMTGLVIAGPWLIMLVSRFLARRASRPATLIAARRLADNPQAGFRAISGLVIAVFVGTCALGVITTIAAYNGGAVRHDGNSSGTLVDDLQQFQAPPTPPTFAPAPPTQLLRAIAGVTGVTTIHSQPDLETGPVIRRSPGPGPVLGPPAQAALCAQLSRTPALGHCPPGIEAVAIDPDYGGAVIDRSSMADTVWPPTTLTPAEVEALPVSTVIVGTDSSAAVERVRTALDRFSPRTTAPQTLTEIQSRNSRQLDSYRQLANVVILTSLPIAGCSLAVSVAGGLAERKRPFSLLRLTGAPLAMLRRVLTLETAAPLLITALVSAGAGLLVAQLFLRAQLSETLQPPSLQYYLVVLAGLLASLAVIASTLPLLRRLTGPEAARND